jgi:hypothetical protein
MSSGLGNLEGILQTDGYAAYDHVGGPKMVHAACWAHARQVLSSSRTQSERSASHWYFCAEDDFLTLISGRIGELTSGVWAART